MHLTALATAHASLRKISSLVCICLLTNSENEAMTYQNEAAKIAVRDVMCNDQTKQSSRTNLQNCVKWNMANVYKKLSYREETAA